jgi:phenylacetate-CoA ligase
MFIYRAVNIYPSHIDLILSSIDKVGSEYQIHLDHRENGRDMMTIRVEREEGVSSDDDKALAATISNKIRSQLLVRTDVEITAYNELPRTQKKSQRVFDHRNGDG